MMIDFAAWGWPQFTLATLMVLGLVLRCAMHGVPSGEHNGPMAVANFLLCFGLLAAGGFWS